MAKSICDGNSSEDPTFKGFKGMTYLHRLQAALESSDSKFNYVVKVENVDPKFYLKPFGRQIDDLKLIDSFKKTAKKDHVGCKGKPSLSAVKAWIKATKPKFYYAKWRKDSSEYKDDSVEIFYI